jgi:hypothetical protein
LVAFPGSPSSTCCLRSLDQSENRDNGGLVYHISMFLEPFTICFRFTYDPINTKHAPRSLTSSTLLTISF